MSAPAARRALLAAPLLAFAPARCARAVAAPPRRVVVAGGGLAEIVAALGARGAVVGADSTSLFPRAFRALPQVGYLRNLSAEGVLSLRPDLLLLAHEAGPPPAVAQLRAAGLRIVQAARVQSPGALLAAISLVAEALAREAEGEALRGAVAADFAALEAALATALPRPARSPRVLFVLAAGAGAPMASGTGTAAEAMLRAAGARSAIEAYEGYRAISAEAALAAAPDWIVAPSHTVEGRGGAREFLAQPQLALLPASRSGRFVSLDTLYLLGWGPRAPHAARDLAAALHGAERLGAALPQRPWLRDEPA